MKDLYRMMMLAPDKGTGDGQEIDVDLDLEEDDGSIEINVEEDEPEVELEEEPEKKEEEKPKEKTVPLKVLEAERAKWKRKVAALESKDEKPGTTEASVDKQKLIDAGFDETIAEMLSKALGTATGKASSTEKFVGKKFRDMEIKELAKEYPDIEEHLEDLEEYADKKGVTIEEAYFAKFGREKIKTNRADLRREIEQQVREEFRKKGSMKLDTTDNGEPAVKNKSKLSSDELQVAKLSGMTPQEYYIMKHAKSFDGISKAMKKKG